MKRTMAFMQISSMEKSYVDDILLASSDVDLLLETKKFLFSRFDMKDLGEASFILGIEIH